MSNCVFCKIISKEAPSEMYYEDEQLVVFKDIKPTSAYHFLAVPKEHIPSVNDLQAKHKNLVERLVECGENVLTAEGGDVKDVRMGFHLPPFNSVGHLHLHLISPASTMSITGRIVYKPDSWWFTSVEQTLERLSSKCNMQ